MTSVLLPSSGGGHTWRQLRDPVEWSHPTAPFTARVAFAAAHVVPGRTADNVPGAPAQIDWEETLAFRRHLWSWGLGVAEAMDTAQRGMGLDWPGARELIERSSAEAAVVGGRIACGAGTDQLPDVGATAGRDALTTVLEAYREQVKVVEGAGAQPIVMASRALAAVAQSPDDYRSVYDELLDSVSERVIIHWLGEMFDPSLRGYWGSTDVEEATESFLRIVQDHADRVDGVKVSLLDADHERALRRALPKGVRLYTGDDFNYPELICDDDSGQHSDALLGVFAAIAPAASAALQSLEDGNSTTARATLESTHALGRHLFQAPTYFYKVGVAFLAWLNGHQSGFQMVGGLATGRSVGHLVRAFELADEAHLLRDPDVAAQRMATYLRVMGFDSEVR